ncbi:tripartite motif-containing protein 16-like [Poecilia latipinna]|uniref:Tripartite motif-containing protein 16-like n=1 Tax=Poecilia formosa TaxID=48698 RepID=A0A096LYR0_POEFO|nr:PREDICTED: tripartite motif-containing protein 16-like [Poecilia latipinna]XP_016526989.1 PREDICTED: tripartite motif-containing protein 16-like [Poecilia formosa]
MQTVLKHLTQNCVKVSTSCERQPEMKLKQPVCFRAAMEQNHLDREAISCSICLDLLKDPVTIPCGHSYCMNCIKGYWDKEDQKRIYSCPHCRETFTQRPALKKSITLAGLVEQLKKTGLQAAAADHRYAESEDVACDFCTGRKLKAIKSCLFCLASYCEKHLQPHYEVAPLKKHKLVEPSKNLQENICSKHDEVMKMFCRTDQKFICYLCSVDEHKGHNTVSAAAERTERQRELEERRGNIQQRIQDREKKVKEQKEKVLFINRSADKSVEACEKIFIDLIHLIQRKSSDVKNHIKSKQEADIRCYIHEQKRLEQEITELKRKDTELKQLLVTEDNIQFLKNYIPESFIKMHQNRVSNYSTYRIISDFHQISSLNDVKAAVSEAESMVQETVANRWMEISLTEASLSPTVKDRDELLKYSQELTLDSNTANRYLSVTRNRAVKKDTEQFKDDSERFDGSFQVLSKDSLSRCSYWEVQSSGRFTVAVAYKDISRKARINECTFGLNETSWALECCKLMYVFRHNKTLTLISAPRSSKIGVFLDYGAGVLSFYSVSESTTLRPNNRFSVSGTRTLLHRVQTRFTQPLLAGIRLYETGDSAEFSQLRQDSFYNTTTRLNRVQATLTQPTPAQAQTVESDSDSEYSRPTRPIISMETFPEF